MVMIKTLEIFVYEDKVLLCDNVSNHGSELGGFNFFQEHKILKEQFLKSLYEWVMW